MTTNLPLYIVNVEAAIYHAGRYLMITRSEQETHAAGDLSLPGGKVEGVAELANVLELTLRREVLEEVGIEVGEQLEYVESSSFINDRGEAVVDIVLLCRYANGEPQAIDPAEVAAVHWLTVKEITEHPKAASWTRQSVQQADQKRLSLGW